MPSDEVLLDRLQRAAFGYFLQTLNPANGLIADTSPIVQSLLRRWFRW